GLLRGVLHLVLDGAQPRRHRRQAARHDGGGVHRPGDGQDRRGARAAGGRHRPRARRHAAGRRAGGLRPRERAGGEAGGGAGAPAEPAPRLRPPQGRPGQGDVRTPFERPRRLRTTPALRRLVSETALRPSDLVLPLFVREGMRDPVPGSSMPGGAQHTRVTQRRGAEEAVRAGVGGLMLFGVPERRYPHGSGATHPRGVLNRALEALRADLGDSTVIMADLCLDEFTDHGHCGVLDAAGRVDNDATLEVYAEMAVAQARAGAHVVAPSGMMDGQVRVIRDALDRARYQDVAILAYTAKYASACYGPFREAVASTLQGDRATYQQDPAN